MKRTKSPIRCMRGKVKTEVTGAEQSKLIIPGSRPGYAFRVIDFKWWTSTVAGSTQWNGNNTGSAFLATQPDFNPLSYGMADLSSPTQFAWCWIYAPNDYTIQHFETIIDPTHMIYDELYFNYQQQNDTPAGNVVVSYMIVLEEYEVTANEQILYQLQEDSQDIGDR